MSRSPRRKAIKKRRRHASQRRRRLEAGMKRCNAMIEERSRMTDEMVTFLMRRLTGNLVTTEGDRPGTHVHTFTLGQPGL